LASKISLFTYNILFVVAMFKNKRHEGVRN